MMRASSTAGYVGCADAKAAKDTVTEVVGSLFESFTLLEGKGFFRESHEPVQLVRIATDDVEKILTAAAETRGRLNQDGVGVEYGGVYYRCTAADCAEALRRRFGERRREPDNGGRTVS
jgi:hypothetical protein